jgi:hypothetical protein
MRIVTSILGAALLFCLSSPVAYAQAAPFGHWVGIVRAPGMDLKVEIDLTRNEAGAAVGIFSQPDQGVKGLPISTIAIDGQTLRFVVKGGAEASTFEGAVSSDGTSMAGEVSLGGMSAPFTLTRTGDARVAPAPKTGRIDKTLEGVWKGTMATAGGELKVVLTVAANAEGIAAGTIVSPNGSGVEIPIGVTQHTSNVTVDVPTVGGSFAAVLNAAGTELTGTWTQGSLSLPLTLRRESR